MSMDKNWREGRACRDNHDIHIRDYIKEVITNYEI